MRPRMGWIVAALFGILLVTTPPKPVEAKPKSRVEWVRVDVGDRPDSAKLAKVFKQILEKAARKANFGDAKDIRLTARLTELRSEQRGDVLHVHCAVAGRVAGGEGARSKMAFGGSPERKEDLEKEVLTMVANGLVARLAQIVRTHPSPNTRAAR